MGYWLRRWRNEQAKRGHLTPATSRAIAEEAPRASQNAATAAAQPFNQVADRGVHMLMEGNRNGRTEKKPTDESPAEPAAVPPATDQPLTVNRSNLFRVSNTFSGF